MKGKRKKGEDTSSETPEKKRASSGRLSGMLESMEKRGSPVNAHRVATAYFESFRKDRNIPGEPVGEKPRMEEDTAVATAVESAEVTAVSSAVKKAPGERKTTKVPPHPAAPAEDPFLTNSELRVYEAIYKVGTGQDTDGVRVGLKELRELTGLSDKTIRMAIHSLTEKLNIEVVEKSLGVYGRKYKVYGAEEVHERRHERGLEVDPATKKVLVKASGAHTAVGSAVSNAVATAVDTTVITAVTTAVKNPGAEEIRGLFEKYADGKAGEDVRSFCERSAGADMGIMEAAIILSALKGKGRGPSVEDVELELGRLGGPLPAGYLEGLRGVWESLGKDD